MFGLEIADTGDVDNLKNEFLIESEAGLDCMERCLNALGAGADNRPCVAAIFRAVHTMKASSGFLGFSRVERLAHAGEALLAVLRDGKCSVDDGVINLLAALLARFRGVFQLIENDGHEGWREVDEDSELLEMLKQAASGVCVAIGDTAGGLQSQNSFVNTTEMVRVEVEPLNHLTSLVEQLVETRHRLVSARCFEGSAEPLGHALSEVTMKLCEAVMLVRTQPVGELFPRFLRMVREVSAACGKIVRLEFSGGEMRLDRRACEKLKEALSHALRNAMDHGIESPSVRASKGKPIEGRIRLRVFQDGEQIVVEVEDDGAGIDCERVLRLAADRGLLIGEIDAVKLLFQSGFSTSEEVTMLSGRGVGLDVVRENVERLGGTVKLDSVLGERTTLRMRIPLPPSIVPRMLE